LNLVYLSLGSNTGDSRKILHSACEAIAKHIGKIISLSFLYETEPWGNKDQPPFINLALSVETSMNPGQLLKETLKIEKNFGRERIERWAPRTLDIDIIYFNTEIIVTKDLKIPHPEIHNRKFVLIPLVEIDPDFIHPVFNISNSDLLKRCKDVSEVKKV
jgi:2-amino-4-hydroxy-6-hydroxymethyldihydropteridine diphosphokinase